MRLWERYQKPIVITVLVLVFASAIAITANAYQVTLVHRIVSAITYPFQVSISVIRDFLVDAADSVDDIWQLKERNDELRERVIALHRYRVQAKILERENKSLRDAVRYMQSRPEYRCVLAKVIGRDPSNWLHMLVIDRGSSDGIKVGMTVIAVQNMKEGLVGRVVSVTDYTAKVLLIVDPQKQNAAAAKVEGRYVEPPPLGDSTVWFQGVLEGSTTHMGRLEMMYLPHEAVIEPGNLVLTSGLGGSYLADIPVGTVVETRVEGYGLLQRAIVKPVVDFNRLYEVLVITSPVPQRYREGSTS